MNKSRKIALMTGGAKRIGKEISIFLAKSGWEIVIHYNNSLEEAKILAKSLSQITNVFLLKSDLNNLAETELIIQKINKEFGDINLLINNASSFIKNNFSNFTIKQLNYDMNVNFLSPAILMKEFYNQKYIQDSNNGNIINILDSSTYQDEYYSYNLSKKSLMNIGLLNAKLFTPKARVNAIALGYVMPLENKDPSVFEAKIAQTLSKKPTRIEEILATIEHILKQDSLNGEIISLI